MRGVANKTPKLKLLKGLNPLENKGISLFIFLLFIYFCYLLVSFIILFINILFNLGFGFLWYGSIKPIFF